MRAYTTVAKTYSVIKKVPPTATKIQVHKINQIATRAKKVLLDKQANAISTHTANLKMKALLLEKIKVMQITKKAITRKNNIIPRNKKDVKVLIEMKIITPDMLKRYKIEKKMAKVRDGLKSGKIAPNNGVKAYTSLRKTRDSIPDEQSSVRLPPEIKDKMLEAAINVLDSFTTG